MSWISEAHNDWHVAHGRYAVCPLDCGAGEALMDMEEPGEGEGIRCGACKGRHWTIEGVRFCHDV